MTRQLSHDVRPRHPVRILRRRGVVGALACVILLISLSGCVAGSGTGTEQSGPRTLKAESSEQTLDVDGVERSFLVNAPERKSDAKLPVVIALHGAEGNGWNFAEWTGLGDRVAEDRYIAVFPNGSPINAEGEQLAWNAGTCCGPPQTENTNDIGFIRKILDELPEYGADPARIFVVGFSNGGMMAHRTACDLGDRIAGIAVVAGAYNVEGCESTNPLPVIVIHGTADEIVPYNGGPPVPVQGQDFTGVSSLSVVDSVRASVTRDECDEAAAGTLTLSESVTETSFTDCAGGYVDLYTYSGLTHTWPTEDTQLDATALILSKFIGS